MCLDNLIIHQKRFEFDIELMRRTKVNDYCEFPMTLSMEQYTREGLLRKEKPEANITLPHPPSYYEYELAGILVHMGTSDSGHYYSYIRVNFLSFFSYPLGTNSRYPRAT